MKQKRNIDHYIQTGMKVNFMSDSRMSSVYIVMTGGAGILLNSMNLFAGSSSINMNVTANVAANCKFVGSAQTLAFGGYDPQATTPLDASSTFQVSCVAGTSVSIAMSNGQYPNGPQRRMFDGVNKYMNYDLFTTAARSIPWNTTNTVNYTAASTTAQTITVYGRVPAGQNVNTGGYSDTVTITATF